MEGAPHTWARVVLINITQDYKYKQGTYIQEYLASWSPVR